MPSFIAIDVETANPFMGSICQIGIVKYNGGQEVDRISWLVDPDTWFDDVNVSIHGISEKTVEGQPKFAQRHSELLKYTKNEVVVCHTHFDRVALKQACGAIGLGFLECTWLDSARVARRAWPEVARSGYGLAPLARRIGFDFRHHDAAEDASAAGRILLHAIAETGHDLAKWLERVEESIIDTSRESVRRAGGQEGPLAGESICFTGALDMPRREAADYAAARGAAVEPGVTKNTTVLVVGAQDLQKLNGHSKSAKHIKAEKLRDAGQPIRIIAESDFLAF